MAETKKRYNVMLYPSTKTKADEQARSEGKTLSQFIEESLRERLEKCHKQ